VSHTPRGQYASPEDLQRLARKVQELDEKREADKRLLLDEIQKLAKVRVAPPPEPRATPRTPPPKADASDKGYEYTIQSGDTLSAIVEAYRKKGVKVTQEQVVKANPKLRPTRLIPGTKIFIPDPSAP
jgi:Tfp pilus assembly protein FimV